MQQHLGKLIGLTLFCSLGLSMLLAIFIAEPFFYIVLSGVILAILSIILVALAIIAKKPRPRLPIFLTVVAYCVVSVALILHYRAFRTAARWGLWSRSYKSEVLAQREPTTGELKHVEWDGWGFPGAGDTTVYLVFDPNDSLYSAAKLHRPARVTGIPCEVPLVTRLENQWYTVLFYTDESWDSCTNPIRH